MAGPWEKYAADEPAGPWTKYGAPSMGVLEAGALGAKNAAMFGFSDELQGLVNASGLQGYLEKIPAPLRNNLITQSILPAFAAIGGSRLLAGDEAAKQRYEDEVAKERALQERARQEQPIAHTVGQVAGAAALPIGVGARAATFGGRVAGSAITGAATGGLTGLGEGETPAERGRGAAIGTGIGGAVGAVAPAVVEPAVRLAGRALEPAANLIRGLRNPEDEAARRIGGAAAADIAAGRAGLTEQEYARELAAGAPVAAIDRLGPAGETLARSAANTSPVARGMLEPLAQERYAGAGERLANWLRGQFHYPDADAQRIALADAATAVNRPAYRRAEQEAAQLHPNGLWDEGFSQIAQAPVVQDAIRKASVTGANRAAREGFTPVGNPFGVDPTTGRMALRENGPLPTMAFWDEVKKNLDKVGSRDAQSFSQVLREHIDNLVPTYGEARAGAAHFFGQRDMLTAGEEFVGASQRYAMPEVRRQLANATPQERQLFSDGYASRLIQQLEAKGGAARTNMLNRIDQSPAAREELALGLGGRDRADALRARLRVESIMGRMRNTLGGSTTARQLAEIPIAGGAGAIDYYLSGGDLLHAAGSGGAAFALASALRFGARQAGHRIDARVVQRVAEMLSSPDQTVVDRGIQMIANNANLMRVLTEADNLVARAAGGAADLSRPSQPSR